MSRREAQRQRVLEYRRTRILQETLRFAGWLGATAGTRLVTSIPVVVAVCSMLAYVLALLLNTHTDIGTSALVWLFGLLVITCNTGGIVLALRVRVRVRARRQAAQRDLQRQKKELRHLEAMLDASPELLEAAGGLSEADAGEGGELSVCNAEAGALAMVPSSRAQPLDQTPEAREPSDSADASDPSSASREP